MLGRAQVLRRQLVGALAGLSLIVFRKHDRNVPIPFGPYLAGAGWLMLIWGDQLSGMVTGR